MTENHPAMFYENRSALHEKIIDFFVDGIKESQQCVFLSTQNDTFEMFEKLCFKEAKSKVLKYFRYYNIPDPKTYPDEFAKKFTTIKEKILNESFEGRVAFNVLEDVSRFSLKDISEIENIEKYLHEISNEKLKLFCSFKVGVEGENVSKMIKMASLLMTKFYLKKNPRIILKVTKVLHYLQAFLIL